MEDGLGRTVLWRFESFGVVGRRRFVLTRRLLTYKVGRSSEVTLPCIITTISFSAFTETVDVC